MDLIEYTENRDIERVNELLEAGVDPNYQDRNGRTALISASANGYLDIVELLLKYDADIHIKNIEGNSALLLAAMHGGPQSRDIVELLLESGANINTRNKRGLTPLMVAARWKPELLNILIEGGANPFLKTIPTRRMPFADDTAYDFAIDVGDIYAVDTLRQYMATIKLQSRHRGRRTRNRIKTQRAKQHLSSSRLPTGYQVSEMIGKHLNKMPYNPEVTRRMNLERAESRLNTAKTMNDRLNSETPLTHLDYDTFQRLSRYL